MYARSTTLMAGKDMDAGIAFLRDEVSPALQAMEGCLGFSLMVDRESGRMIATSSWRSQEEMAASDAAVAPFRERGRELLAAEPPMVQEWEIAAMHRDHHTGEGTCVRSTWSRVPAEGADQAIEFFKFVVMPKLEELDGFCSASLMVDRATGLGVSSAAFDSREAMDASRQQGEQMRQAATSEAGVEILDVAEFELVLAHLHVPELV